MQISEIKIAGKTLVGLTVRTNNNDEFNPEKSKIGPLFWSYLENQTASQFKNRTAPGVTYAVYLEFENDETGDYTYFVGEEVSSLDGQDLTKFKSIILKPGIYNKFTTNPGKMPEVVVNAWIEILQMSDLKAKRSYLTDFEVYDQRIGNPDGAVMDICIGVKG